MTKTKLKTLRLLASGRDPFQGCKGNAIGARANCLYAMQNDGWTDTTRSGWRITPAGRKALKEQDNG